MYVYDATVNPAHQVNHGPGVIEVPIPSVLCVSVSQWRPDPSPKSLELGWTTSDEGEAW